MYIETKPSVEFIRKEKERVTGRIMAVIDGYVEPNHGTMSEKKKDRRDYEKSYSIPKLRKQLSTINFLLK